MRARHVIAVGTVLVLGIAVKLFFFPAPPAEAEPVASLEHFHDALRQGYSRAEDARYVVRLFAWHDVAKTPNFARLRVTAN